MEARFYVGSMKSGFLFAVSAVVWSYLVVLPIAIAGNKANGTQ